MPQRTMDEEVAQLKKNRAKSAAALRVYVTLLIVEAIVLWLLHVTLRLPAWIVLSLLALQVAFILGDVVNILVINTKLRKNADGHGRR